MAENPQAALDVIRNKLQVILLRADLCHDSTQCGPCCRAISEILKEIRALETFVLEALNKHQR
jgi:hypothetical protein